MRERKAPAKGGLGVLGMVLLSLFGAILATATLHLIESPLLSRGGHMCRLPAPEGLATIEEGQCDSVEDANALALPHWPGLMIAQTGFETEALCKAAMIPTWKLPYVSHDRSRCQFAGKDGWAALLVLRSSSADDCPPPPPLDFRA